MKSLEWLNKRKVLNFQKRKLNRKLEIYKKELGRLEKRKIKLMQRKEKEIELQVVNLYWKLKELLKNFNKNNIWINSK